MKSQWNYWKHNTSGEVYAVELQIPDGVPTWKGDNVISACGPLHYSEVTLQNLVTRNFNDEPELADSINDTQDEYSLFDVDTD